MFYTVFNGKQSCNFPPFIRTSNLLITDSFNNNFNRAILDDESLSIEKSLLLVSLRIGKGVYSLSPIFTSLRLENSIILISPSLISSVEGIMLSFECLASIKQIEFLNNLASSHVK